MRPIVLFLLQDPRFEILTIQFINAAGASGHQHALYLARTGKFVPNLGPPLQGAPANGERDLSCQHQGIVDGYRILVANFDGVLRDLRLRLRHLIELFHIKDDNRWSPVPLTIIPI
jgi:hypothetical protein